MLGLFSEKLRKSSLKLFFLASTVSVGVLLSACGGDSKGAVMYIGGIPDQEAAKLNRRFGTVADYLGKELGIKVKYVPSVDYAALVSGFKNGDVHLGWFGGLTGVQARAAAPAAMAIAQRPRDAHFHSVFVVQSRLDVEKLEDLDGLTFTFGSESSTSGHLMPRHFLTQAGIDPDRDFRGPPSFSGSHYRTWKLVESGSFHAGALNEAVWEKTLQDEKVDPLKVRAFYTTPPYFDYNWTIRGDLDGAFGQGFAGKVQAVLLSLETGPPDEKEILDLFQTDRFIESRNEYYEDIEAVARSLGIIQ